MIDGELNETILVEQKETTGLTAMSVLMAVWRAFLDGAAMYGASFHGYRVLDDFRSDAAREASNQ